MFNKTKISTSKKKTCFNKLRYNYRFCCPNQDKETRTRLLAAFLITAVFMFVEAIVGWLSGSLALLADAGHMLTDTAALLMALLAVHFSARQPNRCHTFGYLRLTTLAAFINAQALLFITVMIIWEATHRLFAPHPIAGWTMMFIAIIGLIANIFSFWLLNGGNRKDNINLRAAAVHVVGDLLGSVGAIVAALVILYTGWLPIDPLLSVLVFLLVLRSGWRLLRESLHELLEGAPHQFDIDQIKYAVLNNIPEARSVYHMHIWQIGNKPFMTVHVQIIPSCDHDTVLQRIQNYLSEHYQIYHLTIQVEHQPCNSDNCIIYQRGITLCVHDHC